MVFFSRALIIIENSLVSIKDNMSEETTTQFATHEGQPAFPVEDKETDNSSDSSAVEETNTEQTDSSDQDKETDVNEENVGDKDDKDKDDKKNLADHPRWKERENDWKDRYNEQEKRHVDEISKVRKELDEKIDPIIKSNDRSASERVPDWFGGDEAQWQTYHEREKARDDKIRSDVLKEIEDKNSSEKKRVDEATTYFNEQVKEIEIETGEKIDRNKLIKVAMDNDITDSTGRWNWKVAHSMLKASSQKKASTTEERKKIANATTAENRAETKPENFASSEFFKKPSNRPW